MLKKVMIKIKTERAPVSYSIFDTLLAVNDEPFASPEPPEISEMTVEGKLKESLGKVELKYDEPEISGLGATAAVFAFSLDSPELVTMMRSGMVSTALVFERGRSHICAYNTPLVPFEVGVHTFKIKNALLTDGTIFIDYAVQLRGADAERCKLSVSVKEIGKLKIPKE